MNASWSFLLEFVAWDSEEAEFGLFGYPCLVSLSLDRAWIQSSLGLGFLTRDCGMRERGWVRPKETALAVRQKFGMGGTRGARVSWEIQQFFGG